MSTLVAERGAPLFLPNLPVFPGVDGRLRLAIALHQEAGAIAHLGDRRDLAEIPDDGGQHVLPRLQHGSQIDGLEPPVEEIAARRAFGSVFAIDVQEIPIIRADVNPEVRRNGGERDLAAKVENAGKSSGHVGSGNPGRRPMSGHQLWVQRSIGWFG